MCEARNNAAILVQSAAQQPDTDIMAQNQEKQPTVFIVDDDPAIRFAMQALMDSVNIEHEIYASGDEFLEGVDEHRAGCLVLDIRMPGLGGLELQDELIKRGSTLPIIFITGHGDVPMAVDAMQKGAVDFYSKTVSRPGLARPYSRGTEDRSGTPRRTAKTCRSCRAPCTANQSRTRSVRSGRHRVSRTR